MTATPRPARLEDTDALVRILNAIIAAGGTTAHQRPFTPARMLHHYIAPEGLICCFVAEREEQVAGFQCLLWPNDVEDPFPKGWAIIATFVAIGQTGRGIGAALFSATQRAAEHAGVRTIDATIRADNIGGLGYYAKMGFKDYDLLTAIPLRDGTPVDRFRKRYDLVEPL